MFFFFDAISLFDSIFKSNLIDNINTISKLSIDFFIYLSEKRIEYENNKGLKEIIKNNNLFFLRLTNKFFLFSEDKEEYLLKKKFNMNIIIVIIILLFSGFDIVKQIISVKGMYDIFEKVKLSSEDVYNVFLSKVIIMFLIKSKLLVQQQKQDIKILVDTYISILNDELFTMYRYNKLTFESNIISLEGTSNIYIFKCSRDLTYLEYDIEYFKDKDVYYSRQVQFKETFYDIEPKNSRVVDFLLTVLDYNSLLTSKDVIDKINIVISKSMFPRLYWESEEIKVRPKELKNMFIVNLENTNKFVNIDETLNESKIYIKCDLIYSFFNFGDPYPFIKNLSKKHFTKLLDTLSRIIVYFFPESNPPPDIYPFISGVKDIIDRIYVYYLYYVIFEFLSNDCIENFIENNKQDIQRLYSQELEKFVCRD